MFDRIIQSEARIGELKSIQIARGIRARVFNSADQTFTTGVGAAITFDSERWDTDAFHSTSVNTSRLTIPFEGYYRITGNVRWATNNAGARLLQLVVNGATVIGRIVTPPCAATVTDMQVTADYFFVASDYVELSAQQTSGGNLNVTTAGNASPEFWIEKLIN